MNNKDKEAFEKWFVDYWSFEEINRMDCFKSWQAALEYKQEEIDEITSILEFKKETNVELQAENKKLREALEFTIKAAEHLFQPDKELPKGLFPTAYHTLSYEGDLDLIEKCKQAREALKEVGEE
jgi:regulator of replication initiation timing